MDGSTGAFAERLAAVRAAIDRAAGRSGRPASAVRLIGATKTVPAAVVNAALSAGLVEFGENRVQEAAQKIPLVGGTPRPLWHLIGPLQTNKVTKAVALFDCVQSVDSLRLAEKLDRARGEAARLTVLVEVNVSGEASKHGVSPADAPGLVEAIRERCPHLVLAGLMTVGPLVERPDEARPAYRELARLARQFGLGELSMGMSGDFEVAVEEGATMVRVGSALFGARPAAGAP